MANAPVAIHADHPSSVDCAARAAPAKMAAHIAVTNQSALLGNIFGNTRIETSTAGVPTTKVRAITNAVSIGASGVSSERSSHVAEPLANDCINVVSWLQAHNIDTMEIA